MALTKTKVKILGSLFTLVFIICFITLVVNYPITLLVIIGVVGLLTISYIIGEDIAQVWDSKKNKKSSHNIHGGSSGPPV